MRILLINSHHKIIGGAERYYFEIGKLLEKKGHKVAYFSMHDHGNVKTKWSKYFLSRVSFSKNNLRGFIKKISRMFYSVEARKKISTLLDDFKPDIVHINNIYYYISPSILFEIKKRRIPIVQTVHDYQPITPSITFFHDGKICEISKKDKYYKAILHRCVKHSYMASFMAVINSYIQKIINYNNLIDVFITPSNFMKNKLIEYGIKPSKIVHLNNFVSNTKYSKGSHNVVGNYVLYFGRVEDSKGINLLIDAADKLPDINFKIAGEFDNQKDKKQILKQIKNRDIKNINFLGFLNKNKLKEAILKSQFVVVPSVWFENQPYSILESFSLGKTVVASKIGGIPEIVKENHNGLLFDLNKKNDFYHKIHRLYNNSKLLQRIGLHTVETISSSFNKDIHYQMLINIYKTI